MASVADQFQSMTAGFRQASAGVSAGVGQLFASLATGAKLVSAPLSILSLGLKTLTRALTDPLEVIQSMAQAIHQMVGLANPLAIFQFDLALKDALAVMGKMLTPVMNGLTTAARAFGDTMAKLQPVLQKLFDQFGESIAAWGPMFTEVMVAAAPLISLMTGEFANDLKTMTAGLSLWADNLTGTFRLISDGLDLLAKAMDDFKDTLGIFYGAFSLVLNGKGKADKNAVSNNTAVRTANVQSVEGFANEVFKTSLKNIFGGEKKTPEEQQVSFLEEINKAVAGIWDIAKAWARRVEQGVKDTGNVVEGGVLGATGEMAKYLLGKMFVK